MGDGLFYFAGLWEFWNDPETGPLRTCAIITTEANSLIAPIHNRMPVILPLESQSAWLSHETPPDLLASLLAPHPPNEMKAYPVSTRGNTPRNQDAALIEPAGVD